MAAYNKMIFALVVALCILSSSLAFTIRTTRIARNVSRIKMEYIPDGVSKEQVRFVKAVLHEISNLCANHSLCALLNHAVGSY